MRVLISEKLSEHKYKTPEGYLICTDAILARTGKQTYTRDELFGDGDNTEVNVDRPYNEVMNEKTIASFENKPVTFDHPEEDVNIGNYKSYAVGYVRDVRQGRVDGKDVILGNLVITDQDAINAIENGDHTDLSCGYDCDIKDDGNGNYAQNNIRGNHVALCKEGRAGMARIVDSKVKDSNYIYEFYYGDINNEDRRMMKKYNLEVVGKSGKDRGQRNLAVKGSLENLKRYAKDYLGYELHPDYLIRETDFAYDMYDSVKDSKIDIQKQDFEQLDVDEEYLAREYDIKATSSYGRVIITGDRKDLQRFYNDYRLRDYGVKIIDSKVKDAYYEMPKFDIDEEELSNDCFRLGLQYRDRGDYYRIVGDRGKIITLLREYNMDNDVRRIIDNKVRDWSPEEVRQFKVERRGGGYGVYYKGQLVSKYSDYDKYEAEEELKRLRRYYYVDSRKKMTMSDAIKMLNIIDAYKKVKDSYIVVRNKPDYENAARKLGLTIEKDSKNLRIYGDKYKLKQLQNQFDNDEEILYAVIKDASKDKWVIKNTGLAYEIWNQGRMVKKFPAKKLAVEWIHSRFPSDKIIEA